MLARRISATDRLVRSPASFPSPWARRWVTSAPLRPTGGVRVTGSAPAGSLGIMSAGYSPAIAVTAWPAGMAPARDPYQGAL